MKNQLIKLWNWIDGGVTGDRKFNVFVVITLSTLATVVTYQIVKFM